MLHTFVTITWLPSTIIMQIIYCDVLKREVLRFKSTRIKERLICEKSSVKLENFQAINFSLKTYQN